MATRRDLARVEAQLEQLAQQNEEIEGAVLPLKVVTNILKKQLDAVSGRLHEVEEVVELTPADANFDPAIVQALQTTISSLEARVNQIPRTSDLTHLRLELQEIVSSHLAPIQHQLDVVQQHTQDLDQQQRTLRDWMHRLPQLLDASALQSEIKYLANRVEWAENHLSELQSKVEMPLNFTPASPHPLTAPTPATPSAQVSRSLLEQALHSAKERVIVVYPFPSPEVLDDEMIRRFEEFLARRGCLDIGWGHLGVETDRTPRSIADRRSISPTSNPFLFNRLNQLTELKQQYPDQLRFKVLGTDEYFLVCDRAYAVLGTQSVATSRSLPEATQGLRTTDAGMIQTLIQRFENPVLDSHDAAAFFNRATARYDLGHRQGALMDYTTMLQVAPDDVAFNNRGLVRYDLNDRAGALADFDAAIQHNPQNFVAYTNRGYVRSEQGDKVGAVADYTYAIQLHSDYAIAYFYRGLAQTRLQNKLGAIQDYTEVIRLNPHDASAYFYRGLASATVGQLMEAIRDLRQAAQLFANQGDTTNYQQTLTAMKKLQKTVVIGGNGQSLLSNGA